MQRSLLIRTLMLTDSNFNVNDDDGASFMLILMFQLPHPQERGDADELAKKVRVLCWVMTGPANHKTKAAHVKVNTTMSFVLLPMQCDGNPFLLLSFKNRESGKVRL